MQLVIISGPSNAGKSAAAEALCQRYDRMLHIDVNVLRDFLRMGRFRPDDQSPEAERQRTLFISSATDMACRFLDAGYGVVIDDVVTRGDLTAYLDGLSGRAEPVHFVVLLPDPALRSGAADQNVRERFEDWKDVAVVDSTGLAPGLVADRIMALAAEGRALLPRAAT